MNNSYFSSVSLATGQSVPFTGNWVNVLDARNALIFLYGSGVSSNITANLQTITRLFGDPVFDQGGAAEGINLQTFYPVINGYYTPAFLDSPVSHIRLVATGGAGQVFAFANIQN
jgi:hypothetical protein